MTMIMHEPIWTFQNGVLYPRESNITLDPGHMFVNESDLEGPLYVERGLKRSDVVVGLVVSGLEEAEEEHQVGYLVSDVSTHSGEGILIRGDLAARDPRTWVNRRIGSMWRALHEAGYFLSDFDDGTGPNIGTLDTYIDNSVNLSRRRGRPLRA